jgi:hypothetical protein
MAPTMNSNTEPWFLGMIFELLTFTLRLFVLQILMNVSELDLVAQILSGQDR